MLWDDFRATAGPAGTFPILIGPTETGGSGSALFSDGASWVLAADSAAGYGPPGRRGAAMTTLDDTTLFLFGGMRSASALNDMWAYTATEGWRFFSAGSSAPAPRYHATMVAYGGKLYVYGGKAPGGSGTAMSDLWEFDPVTGDWYDLTGQTAAAGSDLTLARFGHTAVVEGGRMLVFGGHTGADLTPNSLLALHMATLVWSTVPPLQATGESVPLSRMGHAVALDDSVMYIVGGAEGATEFNEYGEIWAYEITSNRWFRMIPRLALTGFETVTTMSEIAMAVVDGHAIFYGGRGGASVSPLLLSFPAGRGSISTF